MIVTRRLTSRTEIPDAPRVVRVPLISDAFTRANQTPISGNGWTDGGASGQIDLISNACQPTLLSNDGHARYSSYTGGADQYARASISVTGTTGGGSGAGVLVRASGSFGSSNAGGYRLCGDHSTGATTFQLSRFVSGSSTDLADIPWPGWSNGDYIVLDVRDIGGVTFLRGFIGPFGREQLLVAVTDGSSSRITSGNPGIAYSSSETAATIDLFDAGTFSDELTFDLAMAFDPTGAWATMKTQPVTF